MKIKIEDVQRRRTLGTVDSVTDPDDDVAVRALFKRFAARYDVAVERLTLTLGDGPKARRVEW